MTRTLEKSSFKTSASVERNETTLPVSHDRHDEQKTFWRGLTLISLLSVALYVALSLFWPKFSRAEVFFAECAREMIAASNYVTPLYHGQGFFDKPILCYWLIISSFETFGITHFVARIPSLIASLICIVTTAVACRAAFGVRAALLAAIALASSFMYLSFSALCMSDMALVAVDTVTLILLYAGLVAKEGAAKFSRSTLWLLGAVSMGVGFLTKGPVAVVLPAVAFIAYLLITRQFSAVKPKHAIAGAIAMIVVALPWFFLAFQANGIESMTYFFIRENVQRFAGATYDTHKPIWFMIVSLFGGFLPWSILLPFVAVASGKRIRAALASRKSRQDADAPALRNSGNSVELYLWVWIAVVIGFFSVSRGKIDYYALPVFPACAILVGYYLSNWIDAKNKLAIGYGALLSAGLIVTGFGLGFLIDLLPYPAVLSSVAVALVPVSIGLLGLAALARKSVYTSYATAFGGVIATGIMYAAVIMPVLIQMSPALSYAEQIKAFDSKSPIGMYSGVDHWIDEVTFRTQREPIRLKTADEVKQFLDGTESWSAGVYPAPNLHWQTKASEGKWLLITSTEFDAFPAAIKEKLVVIQRQGYIPKSINPGYIFKHRDDLTGGSELILARSK